MSLSSSMFLVVKGNEWSFAYHVVMLVKQQLNTSGIVITGANSCVKLNYNLMAQNFVFLSMFNHKIGFELTNKSDDFVIR